MKNLKSVLALVMALCLMLCLAVPAFATETTEGTVVETTAAAAESTAPETTAAAEETLDAPETTAAAAETVDEHEGHDQEAEAETGTEEAPAKMSVLRIILVVLEVIASLILVVVIMMQSGKEGGMGALSGNSESYMGMGKAAGRDQLLAKATKWVCVVWVVLTVLLTLLP